MPKIKSFSTSIKTKPAATEKDEPEKKGDEKDEKKAEASESKDEKKGGVAPRVMKPMVSTMGMKTKK